MTGKETFYKRISDMITWLKKHYYLTFFLVFLFTGMVAFAPFWVNGRSFIWTSSTQDGLEQHYNALMYLGKWGREIISGLLKNHTLEIPLWDFSIGYGSDVITSLHYYAIGDPLNLLSILVPSQYTENLFNFLVLFRVFLAGISFSAYCFYMKKGKRETLLGAVVYMFCGYVLFAFARHPYFINPMIYLPLLLMGAEKLMKKNRPMQFVGIVFLMTISNFYFSYMLLFLLVVYVGVRFFTAHHDSIVKDALVYMAKFAACIMWGLLMASVVFLPTVIQLFSGGRISSGATLPALYELAQYQRTLAGYLNGGDTGKWICLGYAPIAIIALFVLFMKRKKYKELKIGFILLTIMALFPVFGYVFNGAAYVTNRWIFGYSFLIAFIFVNMWKEIMSLSKVEKRRLVIIPAVYFVILLCFDNGTKENTMASMVILLLMTFVVSQNRRENQKTLLIYMEVLCLTILSIGVNVKYQFGVHEGDYISQFIDAGKARRTLYQTGDYALRKAEEDFSTIKRVDHPDGMKNSSWQNKTYGISYFGSLENGVISQFLDEMGIPFFYPSWYQNLDSRTMLNELVSVRYYVSEETEGRNPYGYTVTSVENVDPPGKSVKYSVAENEYALPLGYTYDTYITRDMYESMDPVQRQEALMQGVVLEGSVSGYDKTDVSYTNRKPDYEIECLSNVWKDGDKYIAGKGGAQLKLTFEGQPDCETYVYIKGIEIEGKSEKELYFDTDESHYDQKQWEALSKMRKNELNYNHRYYIYPQKFDLVFSTENTSEKMRYLTDAYDYNHDQEEFVVNLGYQEEAVNSITITLPERGVYDLGDLEVVCQPMTQYEEQAAKLAEDVMENEKIGTNSVSGTISLNEDKILCLSIPYSKGWTAYVDGEETELLQANTMCMAIPLGKGDHSIELRYETPGLKAGAILSGVSLLAYAAGIFLFRKRKQL